MNSCMVKHARVRVPSHSSRPFAHSSWIESSARTKRPPSPTEVPCGPPDAVMRDPERHGAFAGSAVDTFAFGTLVVLTGLFAVYCVDFRIPPFEDAAML